MEDVSHGYENDASVSGVVWVNVEPDPVTDTTEKSLGLTPFAERLPPYMELVTVKYTGVCAPSFVPVMVKTPPTGM
jgi:hypothetical protein